MAAKLLHSLTDDNPDLQKQIGCMTGVFQIFDRHQILTGGRRIVGHNPKEITAGSSEFNGGPLGRASSNRHQQLPTVERHSSKSVQDKYKLSTESSRASFSSSSRSSSFSSVDCNKLSQPETSSFDRIIFPEIPSRDPSMSHSNASPQLGRQSLDLRDVVKDSMYREVRVLSVNNTVKEEVSDVRESLRALAKLQETPWYFDEPRELSRSKSFQLKDGSSLSISKDAPRFSYDGRETNNFSYESRDTGKSNMRLKELPRLSLDSRESSMRSLNPDSKSSFISRNPKRDYFMSEDGGNMQKTSATQARPPSVVAKLMGLETLPNDSKLGLGPTRMYPTVDINSSSRSSEPSVVYGTSRMPTPSRSSPLEPISPRWRNPDITMKAISRFPIEPAPWKPASRNTKAPPKAASPFPSVYSEIEKRLKHLEFTQSGKDLRALKQILEAMQTKGLLDTRKAGQNSHFSAPKDQEEQYSVAAQKRRFLNQGKPIVIMKPAKLVEKSGFTEYQRAGFAVNRTIPVDIRVAKDQTVRTSTRENNPSSTEMSTSGRQRRPAQVLTRQHQVPKESATSPGKNSNTISPRLQQKKVEQEKRSRPPTPPSDSIKQRKQANKQQSESTSPGGGRRKSRPSNFQKNDGRSSDSNTVPKSKNDRGVISSEMLGEVKSRDILSVHSDDYSPRIMHKKSTSRLSEDESLAELAMVTPEYRSPVSVLDDEVYMDDEPSPVNHMLKDDALENSSDDMSITQLKEGAENASNTIVPGLTSEINRQKLQNIDNLVQKLKRLNSTHDEDRTDYIASLCENTNPDHRYISEILLASGLLLRDLGSGLTTFQFHPSGHPINPELFLVLEQTKSASFLKEDKIDQRKPDKEKSHRKLIFDAVNEVLVRKLAVVGPLSRPQKLVCKTLNAQKLLRDLCLEIEQLEAKKSGCNLEVEEDGLKSILFEDVANCPECWTDFQEEMPVIVLDMERLIFKDLVNEIVNGELSGRKAKPSSLCRQLFLN